MRHYALLVVVLLLWGLFAVPGMAFDQPDDELCPDFAGRLAAGERGRVTVEHTVNLRGDPSTTNARLGVLSPGTTFDVLSGPVCAGGYLWWEVEADRAVTENGLTLDVRGYVAEGDPASGTYWLEPRGVPVMVDGVAFVELPDGTIEREGCLRPPDDYERVQIGWATLNRRTLFMLDQAQRLFDAANGSPLVDFRTMITQGSYNAGGVSASFGTHDGGGAVDISVRSVFDFGILIDEMPDMIDALRVAGFAAWVRETGELYDASPIHIHAIAVGDAELSPVAREQIDGEYGYLRGYNGLPEGYGGPALDRYGEPVVCAWMIDMGFGDMREENDAD